MSDVTHVLGAGSDMAGVGAAADIARLGSEQKVIKTAQDFESLLIGEVLAAMRKTVHWGEEPTTANSTFASWFDQHIAQSMAEHGGFGLAESVSKEMQGQINGPKVVEKSVDK